ncbi:MAG: adenylate kinase [Clostridia bacterium]|nr:adenylate kinase [Clostridia bacterium]
MVIIMLGAPGTGKGTVSAILKEKLEIAHVSSGDIFRKYSSEDSELGREINSYLQQGKLVPDELTIKMIKERLNEKDVEKGVILDGFPRTEAQAVALDKMLSETGKKVDLVVDLDSPKQEILDRIVTRRICQDCKAVYNTKLNKPKVEGICDKCGGKLYQRDDDTIEKVETRIEVYKKETKPLEEYYNKKGNLFEIEVTEKTGTMAKEAAEKVISKINSEL